MFKLNKSGISFLIKWIYECLEEKAESQNWKMDHLLNLIKQLYLELYDACHQAYGMYKHYHCTPSSIPL